MTPDAVDPSGGGEKRFLPRWVMWLALPAALGPLAILGFVLVTERAHDPDACPFEEVGRREVAPSLAVIEAARRCVEDIEERRWTIVRDGKARVLGNRRLDRDAFGAARYHWTAELSPADEVRVTVTNEGHGYVVFREGTAEERKRDGR